MEERIKELEEKSAELCRKIAELKSELENKKSEKWIPKDDEEFYYLNTCLKACVCFDTRNIAEFLKYNKIFKTREEALRYSDYLKARHEYSYEFSREEWEDSYIEKCYLEYSFAENDIIIYADRLDKKMNGIYFKNEVEAQEFIDKYKKEILEFEFGIVEE